MAIGLTFKGFFVSGVKDPSVFNGHKFYSVTLSDGEQDFVVSCGQDNRGEVICSSLVLFDKLYDGVLGSVNGKLSMISYEESKLTAPVIGLAFSGLRVSSIPNYVSESKDGIKYYSANFTDGKQVFTMSLGADSEGLKKRDSLVTRSVLYDGTIRYIDLHRKDGDIKILAVDQIKAQSKK